MESSGSKPHAVLLSSPGMGHLIPILELGKRFVTLQHFEVTIFVVSFRASVAETEIIQSAITSKLCEVIELPPVDISGVVNPAATVTTRISVMMREIKPALRSAISALKRPPSVFVVDLFGTESLEIADDDQYKIPKYVFIASNAYFVALTLYTPFLDKVVEGQYVDEKEPFAIPGCKPVRPENVVDPMLDRTNQEYFEYLRICVEIPTSDGILVNTWEDLEPAQLAAIRDEKLLGRIARVPIFPIGPMVRPVEPSRLKGEIFDWLDKQPDESVLLVSFGSGGTLSLEQTAEVAWGLELSQQRFLWLLRPPTVETGDGSFFSAGSRISGEALSKYLPEGFLFRTQEVGLVVSQWAPQVEILSHSSVGGFLSHCGWNSTLESVTNGVPIIAWPLYAEQRMNAMLLSEEIGIAIKPKLLPTKGAVGREEIKIMIRKIMVDEEGNGIRAKVKEVKSSAERAWKEDGSCYNAMARVAECITESLMTSTSQRSIK